MAANQHQAMGKQVGDTTLTDANRQAVSLFSLAGANGLVLGFLHGTSCAYCLEYVRRSNEYADPLRKQGVELVWVLKDTPSGITTFLVTARPLPRYRVLPECEPPLVNRLQLADTAFPSPTLIYLDSSQTIRFVHAPENPHTPHDMNALLHIIGAAAQPRNIG